jgi:hypothetical protein
LKIPPLESLNHAENQFITMTSATVAITQTRHIAAACGDSWPVVLQAIQRQLGFTGSFRRRSANHNPQATIQNLRRKKT